jgi:hypothetical protein
MSQGGRISEEARFELTLAAGARERRNRPLWMVAGAVLVLAITAIAALTGVVAHRSARAQLQRGLEDLASVEHMAAQFRALDAVASQAGQSQLGQPMQRLQSNLEALATRAGFTTPPLARNEDPSPPNESGIIVRRLNYFDVREPSLGKILEWLRLATQDPGSRIPGLEIESLRLKPEGNAWNMNLRLRRWERAS